MGSSSWKLRRETIFFSKSQSKQPKSLNEMKYGCAMYGRGRSRGGTASRSLDRSETSSTRSGTKLKPLPTEKPKTKVETEKAKGTKNTPVKGDKAEAKKDSVKSSDKTEAKKETNKQKSASPATTPFGFKSRASSRSPARGAGVSSPARGEKKERTSGTSRIKGPLKIPAARSVSPKGSPANKAKTKQGKAVKAKTSSEKQVVETGTNVETTY